MRGNSSSYKIDYILLAKDILNPKEYQNCIIDSKVTAILLKGWMWSLGEVALGRVCDPHREESPAQRKVGATGAQNQFGSAASTTQVYSHG